MKTKYFVFLLFLFTVTVTNAQSGKILFEDHFDENDHGWSLGVNNDVVRKIEDGKLIMECKKLATGGGYWIKAPDLKLPSTNYSVSLTTHWIKNSLKNDTYSPYGMIIGDYYFLIYADGNRRLLKYNTVEKKYETIVDWGVSEAITKTDEGVNKLEIVYKDGKAAFYANGQMLYKKEMVLPEGSAVKLYIEKSEVVSYDDLIVKTL